MQHDKGSLRFTKETSCCLGLHQRAIARSSDAVAWIELPWWSMISG